ncbi:hypothetical protein H4F94_00100, partial [Streptomyces sp. SP18CM02]|nr:hypothetical protein [Streptomyces sp. SP18CM02]
VTTTVVITARPTVPVTVAVVTAETAAPDATAPGVITPEPTPGRPGIIATRAAGAVVTPVEPTTTS